MAFKSVYTAWVTPDDKELLKLLAKGLTHFEIGKRIFLSPRTIDKMVVNLLVKLEAKNTPHLISIAYEKGHLVIERKWHKQIAQ